MRYLREANSNDLELLYYWVNDDAVRASAFSTGKITPEEHKKWFAQLLEREDCKQYIFMEDGEPIGQVRININEECAEIDYSICEDKRCKGYGKEMLAMLTEQVKQDYPQVQQLVAKVKPDNLASQRVFTDIGYSEKYLFYEMSI